jgi:hypothetical protein
MSIWYKWLRRLVGKVTPAARRNPPRTPTSWRARLLIETLESRTTPDASITSWTLPPAGTYKLGDVLNFTATSVSLVAIRTLPSTPRVVLPALRFSSTAAQSTCLTLDQPEPV